MFHSTIYKSQLNRYHTAFIQKHKIKWSWMSSIYDTEKRVEQGLGNIKEENGYQQWDMVASWGLMYTFISPIFLSKLLLEFWVYWEYTQFSYKIILSKSAILLILLSWYLKRILTLLFMRAFLFSFNVQVPLGVWVLLNLN